MNNRQKDILCSVIFILFGSAMLYFSLGIKKVMENDVGSGYVPAFIALCIIAAAGAKLVLSLLDKSLSGKKKSKDDNDLFGGLGTVALMAAYVGLFETVGFMPASTLYLFAQMLLMSNRDNRRPLLFAVIALLLPIGVHLLFQYVIEMPLPLGILESFLMEG